jgi:uncharacterized membrane protein YbaN (DUF454 family)
LRDWERHGAISRRSKALALAGMLVSWGLLLAFSTHPWIPLAAGAALLASGAYVVTRPEPPKG